MLSDTVAILSLIYITRNNHFEFAAYNTKGMYPHCAWYWVVLTKSENLNTFKKLLHRH